MIAQFIIVLIGKYCSFVNWLMSLTVIKLIHNIIDKYYLKKLVEPDKDYESISSFVEDEFKECYKSFKNHIYDFEPNPTILLIAKRFNRPEKFKHYIVRKAKYIEHLHSAVDDDIKSSNVYFINIEYSSKRMKEPIHIKLPIEYFVCDNELLSNTFIMRYLLHNYGHKAEFSEIDYQLVLMDDKFEIFTLGHNEHIKIYENHYEIVNKK